MIPKQIHYCWFGHSSLPKLAVKCIESWKRYCPDYEIKEWNENNFDVNIIPYTKEAYEAKKYAFVTDYVRLYALFTEGGIYMDTDVEVLKPYDSLLDLSGFIGFEGTKHRFIGTGTIASEPKGQWAKEQLKEYDDAHFKKHDGSYDLTTNPIRISRVMRENGFEQNGQEQSYKDMRVFPTDFFCPRQTTGEYLLTDNTYCDHHFMGSWNVQTKTNLIKKIIGQKYWTRLIKIKRIFLG